MAVAVASEARTTGREAAVLPESIAMKTRMRGWWVKHKTALLVVLLVAILGVLYLLAEAGYDYSWTGFGSYAPPLSCSPRSRQVAMLGSSDFCWAATQARLNSSGV